MVAFVNNEWTKNGHQYNIEAEYNVFLQDETTDSDGYIVTVGKRLVNHSYIAIYVDGVKREENTGYGLKLWDACEYQKLFQAGSKEVFPEGSKSIEGLKVVLTDPEIIAKVENFLKEVIADGQTEEVAEAIAKEEAENKTSHINAAKSIIAKAEQEIAKNGKLLTEKEVKLWQKNWNNVVNEGGEGYIPDRVTAEAYQWALDILKEPLAHSRDFSRE